MNMKIFVGIVIAFVATVLFGGLAGYQYINALRNDGITKETALNAQYLSNQNYLSTYVSGFYEQLGIVKYKSDKLDSIITDYAKGRTGDKSGDKAAFINAVRESVPNLDGLNIADRMMDYVAGGRVGYRNQQDKLLDMLRNYDTWRESGIVQSVVIRSVLGCPSDHLEARIGLTVLRGSSARDKMYQIVLAGEAVNAYQTGQMAPLSAK